MWLPLLGGLLVIVAVVLLVRSFDRLYAIEERRRAGLPWADLRDSNRVMIGCGWALIALFSSVGFALLIAEVLHTSFLLSTVGVWAVIFGLGVVAYRRNRDAF
jgi:hypothetical protein